MCVVFVLLMLLLLLLFWGEGEGALERVGGVGGWGGGWWGGSVAGQPAELQEERGDGRLTDPGPVTHDELCRAWSPLVSIRVLMTITVTASGVIRLLVAPYWPGGGRGGHQLHRGEGGAPAWTNELWGQRQKSGGREARGGGGGSSRPPVPES